jgi:uncharacterized protein DUF1552
MIVISSASRARFSRRALLRRLGASAAMLPLLHAERARGATDTGFPKRLITIAWSNGVAQPSFYPPGDDPTASDILQPLAPFKAKVLLPCGLDIKIMVDNNRLYDGHFSYPTLFTGTYKNIGGQNAAATGPSVDQVVSDAVAKQVNLPVPLLGVVASGRSTSFRPDGQRNTGETDPVRLYDTLFAGRTMAPAQMDTLRARRKSVIDYLNQDLTGFSNRLGTEDRTKIAAHLDSVRKLELELSAAPSATACTVTSPGPAADYQAKMKVFSDLVATAVRCDLTRSVSLVWADDGGSGPSTMPFLGFSAASGGLGEVHAIAHQGAPGYPQKIKIDTWYMTQLAYLAKLLDDSAEAGGTTLDHSVIAMGNDMTEGSFHSITAIPFILMGSAGGYFRTGRTVRLGSWAGKTGQYWRSGNTGIPHNRLLASLCNALDVPMDAFGAPGYAGTLSELR